MGCILLAMLNSFSSKRGCSVASASPENFLEILNLQVHYRASESEDLLLVSTYSLRAPGFSAAGLSLETIVVDHQLSLIYSIVFHSQYGIHVKSIHL